MSFRVFLGSYLLYYSKTIVIVVGFNACQDLEISVRFDPGLWEMGWEDLAS